jgi:5-methyltetrahydrofolate--homocysteine methyltransferase
MSQEDREICEELLFHPDDQSLFKFIGHFSDKTIDNSKNDEAYEAMSDEEKIAKLPPRWGQRADDSVGGDKHATPSKPDRIVNEILIDAMKVVGELFGSGKMQLPFVLQSAETMKTTVDYLNPYLSKQEKDTDTTLVIGTVKGDVHDVGKNLVDIILSNNGFKVVNIGIKTELEEYLDVMKTQDIHAIGMSGLLVKSTQVMKDNLEIMAAKGITTPVSTWWCGTHPQFRR